MRRSRDFTKQGSDDESMPVQMGCTFRARHGAAVGDILSPAMKPYWQGVFPAITTQMHKDGSLDIEGTAAHADVLIQSGIAGLDFLGSLGENQTMAPDEKRLLRESLLKARGNRTKAAELLGVSRRTLHRKLAQWPELDVTDA